MPFPFFIQKYWKKYFPYFLIAPTFIWVIAFMIFPLIYSLNLSFHSWEPAASVFIGGRNYVKLLVDERFHNALGNTFIFTSVTVSLEFLFGLLIALSVNKVSSKTGEKIFAISVIPIVLTPVITGILWRIILHADYGILNYYLMMLGFPRLLWLSDRTLALVSCMLVDIWRATPFVALVFMAGISAIPKEPLEAAQMDGANYFQIFKHVMLPYLRTILMLILLLRVIESILFFDINYILTMGGPGTASELVSLYIYKNAFWFWHLGYSSAMSYIILIIADIAGIALFLMIFRREKM